MESNLINAYIKFKKNKLLEIGAILYEDNEFLKSYIDTYVLTYYYHILGTLDYEDVKEYDYKVVKKELEGTCLELLQESDSEKIKISLKIALMSIIIDRVEFLSNNLDDITDGIKELEEKKLIEHVENINELVHVIKKYNIKENKFLLGLNNEDFKLKYKKYRNNNCYNVELEYDIKQLGRYKDASIERAFNSDNFLISKLKILINLLNIDVLKKIMSQENSDIYFVNINSNQDMDEIFLLANNNYLKEHLIFILDGNFSYKQFINSHKEFSFALDVDMSHINNVRQKLDSLNELEFKYIILSNIKNKDYEYVHNRRLDKAEIIINEFDGGE